MLRNITLTADDQLIGQARKKATAALSTLNVDLRKWLASCAGSHNDAAVLRFRAVMQQLGQVDAGRTFTR
ncbi:MAG: hypothetical protein KBF66_09715 [Rhodoferax sp.]|uniref:hypothetical protein n=1 Tax=Rhodoferax sp. TaxID=50421 RepID=UPI001B438F3D|nr:hypothetical protein [Rhodoferax sp.]MBP9905823.1 hypothetical protein [Rhodoferax sp.]